MQGSCLPGGRWSSPRSFFRPFCRACLTSSGRASALRFGTWKKSSVMSLVRPELPRGQGEPAGAGSRSYGAGAAAPGGSSLAFGLAALPSALAGPPGPLGWQAAPSRCRCQRGLAGEVERWVRMGSVTEHTLEPSVEPSCSQGSRKPAHLQWHSPPRPSPELLQRHLFVPRLQSSSPAPPAGLKECPWPASRRGLCGSPCWALLVSAGPPVCPALDVCAGAGARQAAARR